MWTTDIIKGDLFVKDFLLRAGDLHGDDQGIIFVFNAKSNWFIEQRLRTALRLRHRLHVALLHAHHEGVSRLRWQVKRLFHRNKQAANWSLDSPVGGVPLAIAFVLLRVNLLVEVKDPLGELKLTFLELNFSA